MGAEDGKKPRPLKFRWMDELMENSDLDPATRYFLLNLSRAINSRTGVAYPSQAKMASDMGHSERYVKTLTEKAKAAGWIEVEVGKGMRGPGGRTNLYRARFPPGFMERGDVEITPEDEDEEIHNQRGDLYDQRGDAGFQEGVMQGCYEEEKNKKKRIRISDPREKKRGSGEFLQEILNAIKKGPKALRQLLKEVKGFTVEDARWVISGSDKLDGQVGEGGYIHSLTASVLQDMWRKELRFTGTLFTRFLVQAAELERPDYVSGTAEIMGIPYAIEHVFEDR